jgi:hypothetical protein
VNVTQSGMKIRCSMENLLQLAVLEVPVSCDVRTLAAMMRSNEPSSNPWDIGSLLISRVANSTFERVLNRSFAA